METIPSSLFTPSRQPHANPPNTLHEFDHSQRPNSPSPHAQCMTQCNCINTCTPLSNQLNYNHCYGHRLRCCRVSCRLRRNVIKLGCYECDCNGLSDADLRLYKQGAGEKCQSHSTKKPHVLLHCPFYSTLGKWSWENNLVHSIAQYSALSDFNTFLPRSPPLHRSTLSVSISHDIGFRGPF